MKWLLKNKTGHLTRSSHVKYSWVSVNVRAIVHASYLNDVIKYPSAGKRYYRCVHDSARGIN